MKNWNLLVVLLAGSLMFASGASAASLEIPTLAWGWSIDWDAIWQAIRDYFSALSDGGNNGGSYQTVPEIELTGSISAMLLLLTIFALVREWKARK